MFQRLPALQTRKVKQFGVRQMRGHNVLQRGKHAFNASWEAFVPIFQHIADNLALQIGLRAAQVAGDDGELF